MRVSYLCPGASVIRPERKGGYPYMLCPICNGLKQLTAVCQVCAGPVMDCGRSDDYSGPYSPYQPVTNAAVSAESMVADSDRCCSHVLFCPNCGETSEISIAEWQATR